MAVSAGVAECLARGRGAGLAIPQGCLVIISNQLDAMLTEIVGATAVNFR